MMMRNFHMFFPSSGTWVLSHQPMRSTLPRSLTWLHQKQSGICGHQNARRSLLSSLNDNSSDRSLICCTAKEGLPCSLGTWSTSLKQRMKGEKGSWRHGLSHSRAILAQVLTAPISAAVQKLSLFNKLPDSSGTKYQATAFPKRGPRMKQQTLTSLLGMQLPFRPCG